MLPRISIRGYIRPSVRPLVRSPLFKYVIDGWTNEWTDRNSPCVLQDFIPFRSAALKMERHRRNYPRHWEEEGDCAKLVAKWPRNNWESVAKRLRSRRHKMTEFCLTRYQIKGLGHCNNNWSKVLGFTIFSDHTLAMSDANDHELAMVWISDTIHKRERDRQTDKQTQTETDRKTQRQTETKADRDRQK